MRVVCVWMHNPKERERLAEACLRFTPQVALGPQAVFLEISRCRTLYREESLLARLRVLLKRFDIHATLAIAQDPATAAALACFGKHTRASLPLEAAGLYLQPFSGETKPSVALPALEALHSLGIYTLGELVALPRHALASRLGKSWLAVLDKITTPTWHSWPMFTPPERVIESRDIDPEYSVMELEPLLFIIKQMVDSLTVRLRGRGRLASSLELGLTLEGRLEDGLQEQRRVTVDLVFAQGSALGLLGILKERLASEFQRAPLASAAISVRIEVTRTVPAQARQTDFFSKKEEAQQEEQELLSRLIDKLGVDRAFYASPIESYVPERSWKKSFVSEHASIRSHEVARRPLRMLQHPRALQRLDQYLFVTGRGSKQRWKILRIEGPERVMGEWWCADRERDYYTVYTSQGERLWVFQQSDSQAYFLHGIFD